MFPMSLRPGNNPNAGVEYSKPIWSFEIDKAFTKIADTVAPGGYFKKNLLILSR